MGTMNQETQSETSSNSTLKVGVSLDFNGQSKIKVNNNINNIKQNDGYAL